jgi:hypothetical protein
MFLDAERDLPAEASANGTVAERHVAGMVVVIHWHLLSSVAIG